MESSSLPSPQLLPATVSPVKSYHSSDTHSPSPQATLHKENIYAVDSCLFVLFNSWKAGIWTIRISSPDQLCFLGQNLRVLLHQAARWWAAFKPELCVSLIFSSKAWSQQELFTPEWLWFGLSKDLGLDSLHMLKQCWTALQTIKHRGRCSFCVSRKWGFIKHFTQTVSHRENKYGKYNLLPPESCLFIHSN